MSIGEERRARFGRLRRGVGATAVSRVVTILAPLVTIPVGLEHLGATDYGAWSAALALTGFAVFADLGLGAGLMTRLADALSKKDTTAARILTSSAYATLLAIVAVLVAVLGVCSLLFDLGRLVGAPASPTTSAIVYVTLAVFLFNIVASLIVRVQFAAQQIARASFWQAGGTLAGVAATFLVAWSSAGPTLFIAIVGIAPLLVALMNTFVFFSSRTGREFRPSVRAFRVSSARSLLSLGGGFLLINVLIAASTTTDSLIVANTVGLTAVPEYAIPARVFSILAVATAVLAGPLWPINVEALAQGDVGWVRSTTRKMALLSAAVSVLLSGVGVIIGPAAIRLWLGGALSPSTVLLVGLAFALIVQAFTSPYFMVQNAAAVLSPQIVGYSLLLVTFPLKWFVSSRFGFEFIPYISAIGFAVFLWPAVYVGYRRSLVRATKIRLPSP